MIINNLLYSVKTKDCKIKLLPNNILNIFYISIFMSIISVTVSIYNVENYSKITTLTFALLISSSLPLHH